jgi:hypothetical protein
MEEVVSHGWAAFSRAQAVRQNTQWLDLVRIDGLKRRLMPLVEEFERQGYRPQTLEPFVSVDQARERWTALKNFYNSRGHFLVTNGPYILKNWSQEVTVFEVFRNFSYPLGVGSYDSYAIPRRAYITKVERNSNGLKIFADVEQIVKIPRDYEIVRAPLQTLRSDVRKPGKLICRYVVVNADGKVSLAGYGRLEEDGTFAIDLNGKLKPGSYTIMTALYLVGNTMNPGVKQISYTVRAN